MKKFLLSLFLLLMSSSILLAYTKEEVSTHNSADDCWVVFNGYVYDVTNYVTIHDRFVDIRGYCGTDITDPFKTKGGEGKDHKASAYQILETFSIGKIDDVPEEILSNENETRDSGSPYRLLLPILLTTSLYWIFNYIAKKGYIKGFTILKFNALFTTSMLLLFFIPTFGFGIFMILRYEFSSLYDIDFDFLFWHAQLALIMGTLAMNHYLQRSSIYWKQLLS